MFFTESEYLLHEGVAGKTVIEAVDRFLSDRSRDDVLDAELVTRHTDQPPAEVQAVLAGLAARAALSTQRMVRCPGGSCRTLTPASKVEASRADGDEEPCDGPCGQDLSGRDDLEVVEAYKLVAQPVL
jgi:hypothetical protein